MTQKSPLIIIGLDAADPDLLEQWVQAGYLPTLASIMARGTHARIGGPHMITEHSTWVTLASGLGLDQHHYYYLRQLKPGTYDLETVDQPQPPVKPFWAYMSDGDYKVAVLDVTHVFPVNGLPGFQVTDWAPHYSLHAPVADPPNTLQKIEQAFGPRQLIHEQINSTLAEDRAIYQALAGRARKKAALCRQLLTQDSYDLIFVVFGEPHTAGHQFWDYQAGRPKSDQAEFQTAIRDIYQIVDQGIGSLLAVLPPEANICLLSSCGLQDQYPMTGLIESFCRQLGYQATPPASAPSLNPMALARRLLPESWRVALSRNLSRERRERLLADRFRAGTDWSRTTAFVIPSFYTSFIQVNLRGREPQGIVEPGADYEALLDRLEQDLLQLIDPVTTQPAVKQVHRTAHLFGGKPPSHLPDLFVEWQPVSHFIPSLNHPKGVLNQPRPEFFRSSDHTQLGFAALAGPSIARRGRVPTIDALDLAPTFLSLLGVPPVTSLQGRILHDFCTQSTQ